MPGLHRQQPALQGCRALRQRGILEVTGHNDEHGNFVRYEKPLRFPTSEVPNHADGTFNIDELMAFVERGAPRENKMEPALRHVVRELAPEVQGALASLGLETTGDFHHFWPSAQQCYEELESILARS